jgi:hypothetical protein
MKYKSFLAIFIAVLIGHQLSAQIFIPDRKGHVADPAFQKVIKQNGYQLVGAFDTVQKKPLTLQANVIKNGQLFKIDTRGVLLPAAKQPQRYTPVERVPGSSGDGISIDAPDEDRNELFEQVVVNGKYGTRHKVTKKPGLPVIYDGLSWYGKGLVSIESGSKTGFAYTDGRVVLQPKYDLISRYGDDGKYGKAFYVVQNGGKYGVLNGQFKEVFAPRYDYLSTCSSCDVSDNLLMVSINNKQGLATKTGKELVSPVYDQIRPLFNPSKLLSVKQNGKIGLIDTLGRLLVSPEYDYIQYDSERNTFSLSKGNSKGLADGKGHILVPSVYSDVYKQGNAIIVELNDKYGFADAKGKMVTELVYDHLFTTGKQIIASRNGKFGALDPLGKILIPFNYDNLDYDSGKYFFKNGTAFGIMNALGTVTAKLDYDDVKAANGYLIIKKTGKSGVADMNGKVLIHVKYDNIRSTGMFLKDGTAAVTLDGRRGVVDLYGNELFK